MEEEEEERKLVELEVKRKESELQSLADATKVMAQQRAIGSSSWTSALARSDQLRRELKELRGEKRKKRKKRKKKLPKTSSGSGRPCDHHRRVPAVRSSIPVHPQTLGLPGVTQRQVPAVHSFMLPVQLVDKILDVPVVVLRQVLRSIVPKTVVVPQLHFIDGRRLSLSFRRGRSPRSRQFSRPQRFSSCCSISGGRCPCCAGRAFSPVLSWRRSWRSHSCSSLKNRRPLFPDCRKLPIFRSCTSSGSLSSCRDAEVHPHGLCDHGDSPVAFGHGGQCPCYAVRAGFHLCALFVVCGHGTCMAGLLVTLHPAVCSLACRPLVADNSGSTRLVFW